MNSNIDVVVGSHVWVDGSMWQVQEIAAGCVVISCGPVLRRVGLAMLACGNEGASRGVGMSGGDVDSVPMALARLTDKQRRNLAVLENELIDVLDPDVSPGGQRE